MMKIRIQSSYTIFYVYQKESSKSDVILKRGTGVLRRGTTETLCKKIQIKKIQINLNLTNRLC